MFNLRNIFWGMTALSIGVIAAAVLWLVVSVCIVKSSVRADGKVVKLIKRQGKDGDYFCPIAVFRDQAGVERTISSSVGSNPPRFPVGRTVSILYHTDKPDDAMIEDTFMLWLAPVGLMAIGLFNGAGFFTAGYWLKKIQPRRDG